MVKFSVIVPAYNHGKYLRQRIESILGQTCQDFELILLDDASTDDSRAILESYRQHPKVTHLVYNTTNSGSSFQQWKKGFDLAQGAWIWIAESDDTAEPGFLEACEKTIQNNDNLVMVCTQSSWINEEGNTWYKRQTSFEREGRWNGTVLLKEYMIHENQVKNASAVVFKKDQVLEDDMVAVSEYKWCGDWALWNLLLSKGDLYFIDAPLNHFRRHAEEASRGYYAEGFLYKEGLPLSLHYQQKLEAPVSTRVKAFRSWTMHLLRQYGFQLKKGRLRLYLFAPLYYCILMHAALPFAAVWNLAGKIRANNN